MKRSMYGTLTLAAALLAACSGDPTSDERKGSRLVIDPGFLQINVGSSQTLTVQAVDDQGNALPATFTANPNNAAVVAAAESTTFRPGLGSNRLSAIFRIDALSIDSSSVTFSGGGASRTVPVAVSPLSVPLTLNPATPNVNDLVTLTAAGFKFLPATSVRYGGFDQLVTARAADSSSITIRMGNPGSNLTLDVRQIAVGYLPSVGLNLLSSAGETVGPGITALTGTDAIATAPDVVVPADGSTIDFQLNDAGTFNNSADCNGGAGGAPCRIYKFTLAADQEFDVSSSWPNNSDLGIYFVDASNSDVFPGFGCDQHGTGAAGANFESCTVDLPAGTYYMQVVTFTAFYAPPNNVDPASITVTLSDH